MEMRTNNTAYDGTIEAIQEFSTFHLQTSAIGTGDE
jgi:hypothetical protein